MLNVRSSHAGSTGRCNTGVKSLCWGFKLQGLTWSFVYTDWMKGLMTIMPDGSYEVKSFATDTERNNVAAYGVFSGRRDYLVLDPASFGTRWAERRSGTPIPIKSTHTLSVCRDS